MAARSEETVSTLEFASRCKLVKTSARKNEHSKAAGAHGTVVAVGWVDVLGVT